MKKNEWMANMKRDEKKSLVKEKAGFSEKEFIEYLQERFRKLKLDEQKFREEVLSGQTYFSDNRNFTKVNR